MTSRAYYRWSLTLPVVTPIVFIAVLVALSGIAGDVSYAALPALFLGGSVVIGGLPYALCAIGLAVGLSRWPLARFRVVSYLVPLGFALAMALLGAFAGRDAALFLGACSLAFGYFYVLLAHTGYALLRALGRIHDPVPMPPMRTSERSPSRDR